MFLWVTTTPAPLLREQLKGLQFWSLEACVAVGLALAVPVFREMRRDLHRQDVLRMALLAGAALILTLFVAPRTNRIFYDEHIYQSIGQNLSDLRLAQMCNDGNVEYGLLHCLSGEYNKQPYAFPHLLGLAYRAFGVHDAIAFRLNAVVMALTVCAVYLLALLLSGDRRAASFAAGVLLLIPQQVIWSATAAVEPSASLACVVAVLCAAHFARVGSTVALAATAVACVYAIQFRPESLLIVAVVALLLSRDGEEFRRPRFWWIGLLAFLLVAVHIAHLVAVRNEGWGTSEARLSFAYLPANLSVNGAFYLADERFPVMVSLLAVLGLAGVKRSGFAKLVVSAWFLAFFGIFLLFYAGSYNYGADVRYSLMTYPPIAVLGGFGAARIAGWLDRVKAGIASEAVLAAALVFQFLLYLPLIRATTEEAWAARSDVAFAKSLVPALKGNAYVLTHNPGMFHVWGVNAGQMSRIVVDPAYLYALHVRYPGGVYLHWNFWCNVQDVVQREFCQKALSGHHVETVGEHRERDQRFVLYRLRPVPNLERGG